MDDPKKLATEWSAAWDRVGVQLAEAEKALVALGLRVRAEYPYTEHDAIGFGKLNKGWRLLHINLAQQVEGPLTDAPIHVRVEALKHLDKLLAALFAAVRDGIQRAATLETEVASFVERVRAMTPPAEVPRED